MIAFEVDLMCVSRDGFLGGGGGIPPSLFTNNLQIVVKYRVYEIKLSLSNSN